MSWNDRDDGLGKDEILLQMEARLLSIETKVRELEPLRKEAEKLRAAINAYKNPHGTYERGGPNDR